jgi:multisubunit Na+/H+ antiporter MnhC subunit
VPARPHFPGRSGADDAVLRDQRIPVRDGTAGRRPAADLRQGRAEYTDPLPQALVLTAIVIAFGMTALVVVLALRTYLETGTDHVDGKPEVSG